MASFAVALPFVLAHEGGWSDRSEDHGGPTNYGITLALAQRYGIPDANALSRITPEQVADIYRAEFWRYGGLTDNRLAAKVFDFAVNMGPRRAVKLLQQALCAIGDALPVDGFFGPLTVSHTNAADADKLLEELCRQAQAHYEAIAAADPSQAVFLHGWVNRAWDIPEVPA